MKRVLLFFPVMMLISIVTALFNLSWGLIGIGVTFVLAILCGFLSSFFFNKEKMPCEIIYNDGKGGLQVLPYFDWRKKNKIWGIKFYGKGLYRDFGYTFERPNIDPQCVFSVSTDDPEYRRLKKTIKQLYFYDCFPGEIKRPDDAKEIYLYPLFPLE